MSIKPDLRTCQMPISSSRALPAVAVIADAHLHDIHSDYDFSATPFNGKSGTLRSWTDTRRASRVFNESAAALKAALCDIRRRGIQHVVLLGDYTDDGQIEATQRLVSLLRQHRDDHGLQFYAIPGNHDCYGPKGKHQSTRFVCSPGETRVVTSDPEVAAMQESTAVVTRRMYCEGSPVGLLPMSEFGLFKQQEYLHWESPFGLDDAVTSRSYEAHSADGSITHSLMDASYLVEPAEGLWLLMIDANVFEPRNGRRDINRKKAFLDSSDAGWNSVISNKPHLLGWISDVCSRASQLGKTVLAFSHYPTMDPFDDWSNAESRLFGETEMLRRRPGRQVAEALLHTGLQLHLGGHLHVNGLSRSTSGTRQLTDVAVPSLVAFPPAYKTLQTTADHCQIETISLCSMPLDPWLMDYYRAENAALNQANDSALSAQDHGSFLYQRMLCRVTSHFLPREWPAEIAGRMHGTSAADLAYYLMAVQRSSTDPIIFGALPADRLTQTRTELESLAAEHRLTPQSFEACSMINLIADWYCLRQGGHQARAFFPLKRDKLYLFLAREFGELQSAQTDPTASFLAIFLGVLHLALQRQVPQYMLTDTIELQP